MVVDGCRPLGKPFLYFCFMEIYTSFQPYVRRPFVADGWTLFGLAGEKS